MKNTATIIAPIYNITISEPLGRGDRLDDFLWLTNDSDLIRSKMSLQMVQGIGAVECASTCDAGLVAYGEFADDRRPSSMAEAETFIAVQLAKLHRFVRGLWWLKDNAARVENGFYSHQRFQSSRLWPMICTMADGTDCTITSTRQELRAARSLYRKLADAADWGTEQLREACSREVIEPDSTPWSRASYFRFIRHFRERRLGF